MSEIETILPWPKEADKESPIEWAYTYNGERKIVFEEERALAAMLLAGAIFLNSHYWQSDWPENAKKTASLNVNTNDVFMWGCADAEGIGYDEIEEVYRYWSKDPDWGTAVWAIVHNKEMPQRPVEDGIRKGDIWDLDALKSEHGIRANAYDGISGVRARQKREVYEQWCQETGHTPLAYDGGWWEGWKEYVNEHPDWWNSEWKAEESRRIEEWKAANGFGEP